MRLSFYVRFCSSLVWLYIRQRLRDIVMLCESADNTVKKLIKRCLKVLLSVLFSLLPTWKEVRGVSRTRKRFDIRLDY